MELYNIGNWGLNYFDINEKGNLEVYPMKSRGIGIDLKDLVEEIQSRGISLPVLIRFSDILQSRVEKLQDCFHKAIQNYDYQGGYFGAYPIKVNQQRQVVEEIVKFGRDYNVGLEAGSKPELHAVLALLKNREAPIICNGYKDREFIKLALIGRKLGKKVFLVVEKLSELRPILEISKEMKVEPMIGIRIKLTSSGSGKWEASGGERSKFGLTAAETLEAVEILKKQRKTRYLQLIHFHLGSQITNIRRIKEGLREIGWFYAHLRKIGVPVRYVDVGGGLGVDYDGSRSSFASSVNYSIQEYANDVIYTLMEICKEENLPHPHIISESGRAMVAHHAMLAVNVLGVTKRGGRAAKATADDSNVVRDFRYAYDHISNKNFQESYHDALQLKEDVYKLFSMGYLSLSQRAKAENLFWCICKKIWSIIQTRSHVPEELLSLEKYLADRYICNFSVFQSLPDSWAIDHIFPIVPLHRHKERPVQFGTLEDITCDSDGKVEQFIGLRDVRNALPLHPLTDESYYLGIFLVGAYQEILGDLHNLFGDTNAVHIALDGKGGYTFEQVIEGETVTEVLDYVQFNEKDLTVQMTDQVAESVKKKKISREEGEEYLRFYTRGLQGYTYFEE
jgi:arginine decarboxylase